MQGSHYGSAHYGAQQPGYAMKAPFARGQRKNVNLVAVLISLFGPWLLFTAMTSVLSFSIHYNSPGLCSFVQWFCLVVVGFAGYAAYSAFRRGGIGGGEPNWYIFLFASSLIAWVAALCAGSYNFAHNMQPYYDVMNLNVYPSVDPGSFKGQQLMDAGRIIFTPESKLDLQKSMGFRNLDVYCVAPVASSSGNMSVYDFWAVGINCCSGHTADFACGEFNNPMAHSGLRLMRDDLRPYFRLAVQQAEAAYNIKARHPVFLYWMQDPISEINAYQDAGFRSYLFGVFLFFSLQLFFVVMAVILFSRMSHL
eukprot:TRINITY_DN18480_c3_g1_i1.p1 TRINITY_DN18480_c3_g1~~TRINITY_DN18480_c3_g1_i1.p1  ORF type:complete len:309 (-),score=49.95 TRINITY_DN18480_c3_g1_i1:100-1026(-)